MTTELNTMLLLFLLMCPVGMLLHVIVCSSQKGLYGVVKFTHPCWIALYILIAFNAYWIVRSGLTPDFILPYVEKSVDKGVGSDYDGGIFKTEGDN